MGTKQAEMGRLGSTLVALAARGIVTSPALNAEVRIELSRCTLSSRQS